MARNIVIVEGYDDKYTFEAILTSMSITASVNSIQFETIKGGGIDPNEQKPTKLINTLKDQKRFLEDGSKLGIILDLDTKTTADRLKMINNAILDAYGVVEKELSNTDTFINLIFDKGKISEKKVFIACHFINIDGKGEMENLLRKIKRKDASFADCLEEGWQICFEKKGKILSDTDPKNITPKEMIKLWLEIYRKFDVLPNKTKRGENKEWKVFLQNNPTAFDFSNTTVPEFIKLKEFLKMFA